MEEKREKRKELTPAWHFTHSGRHLLATWYTERLSGAADAQFRLGSVNEMTQRVSLTGSVNVIGGRPTHTDSSRGASSTVVCVFRYLYNVL